MQKYSVNQQLIETILAWVKAGEIAIPEIQRPFVWDSSKVRDLMDSLRMNCVPAEIMEMELQDYQEFLAMRRKLMAGKIKEYYFTL